MAEPDLTDRIAHALYDHRRPSYVPAWAQADDSHAMKLACLEDARIAVEVIKEGEQR